MPPPDMPAEDAAIMLLCFETEPLARASFAELKARSSEAIFQSSYCYQQHKLYSYKSVNPAGFLTKVMEFFKPEKAVNATVKT